MEQGQIEVDALPHGGGLRPSGGLQPDTRHGSITRVRGFASRYGEIPLRCEKGVGRRG